MANKRYLNELPKIGIRPTIDGRRNGVRESLEDTTMAMAKATAEFLEKNVKYFNGDAVECVVADTCIGGVGEANLAAEKFKREGVGITITVTPCWCYGSETMDMNPQIPNAIWGFNGSERPGAVYLAAVLSAHNQKGIPAFGIYGEDVQDAGDTTIPADVQEKLLRFTKAALVVATMRGKSYLSIGSVSMGIASSIVKDDFFQEYLGMRNEYIDSTEILRRLDLTIYDEQEYELAYKWVKDNFHIGQDNNKAQNIRSNEEKENDLQVSVKMAIIARDLMVGNKVLEDKGFIEESVGRNALIAGFQGQRQWTDHYPNGDFMETILNSSFDWNGKRSPYLMATENDSLNGVTMAFGHLLTNSAQVFADVRTYWSADAVKRVTNKELEGRAKDGIIHLLNSGAAALDGTGEQQIDGKPAMKPFWEISDEEVEKCIDKAQLRAASTEYFRGGGFSTDYTTRGEMPVTIARINIIKGLGPVLQLAEGYTVELAEDVHSTLDERTDPTWPTSWFVPNITGEGAFTDVYSVMANWGSNHCVMTYGHVGADFITLASMLRIPVNMHNVDTKKIYRPSAWGMFGTQDKEQADYSACKNFGPLYK